jgi:hypothetical protein
MIETSADIARHSGTSGFCARNVQHMRHRPGDERAQFFNPQRRTWVWGGPDADWEKRSSE